MVMKKRYVHKHYVRLSDDGEDNLRTVSKNMELEPAVVLRVISEHQLKALALMSKGVIKELWPKEAK